VNSDFALEPSQRSGDGTAAAPSAWESVGDDAGGRRRFVARLLAGWHRAPLAWRSTGVAVVGAGAATGVAYLTAHNPAAAPTNVAVEVRVVIIGGYIAAGIYAQTSRIQARMGALLIGAGLFSSLWLLNGSSNRVAFNLGVACTSVMPMLVAYVMLAHPTGRPTTHRFLWLTGGTLAVTWLLAAAIAVQPPFKTPLLGCTPHCPASPISWPAASGLVPVLTGVAVASWIALSVGTPILLARRARLSSAPVRQSLVAVWIVAVAIAALLVTYAVLLALWPAAAPTVGAVYIAADAAVPLAILAGLSRERMFMGQALAELVDKLSRVPHADPEALIAATLRDPSLRIAYARPESGTYVDSAGTLIEELPDDMAVTWIERDRRRVAAVLYNPELSGLERFVRASASAALIRLEQAQLEADLRASTSELAASRGRLVEMAHVERRRLERDLHDGVQQHLVGIRIKVDLAAETIRGDPAQGEEVLASVGRQLDDVLQEVRSLARGIYPSLLSERGVAEALRAAGRSAPRPVAVHSRSVGRYAEEIEVAVYFCCLEALQNVIKHAGPEPSANIALSEDGPLLRFAIKDSGVGFDSTSMPQGAGLINMRDRIEAVGGRLEVLSGEGRGTTIRGFVPVA
jgi:signal transduction histidine kinase